MSFIWMIVSGLIAGAIAKVLMPERAVGGLFILGIAGSMIAGVMEYSENQPIGFIAPFVGAAILLAVYAATGDHQVKEEADEDDFRKAA